MNKLLFIKLFLCLATVFLSCRKEPGEGGGATIKGTLYARNFHSPEITHSSDDYASDEKIYIIYGDGDTPDDDTRTGSNGEFQFKYLRKGKYKIYTYSLDPNTLSDDNSIAVIKEVEITKNNEEASITDFHIYEEADNNGSSAIKGKLYYKRYAASYTIVVDQYYKADEDIYFVFGRDVGESKRIRTGLNGEFQLNNLRKGKYKIYALSDDTTMQTSGKIPIIKEVTITENNKVYEIPDIIIAD
jgi:hypothetical protein